MECRKYINKLLSQFILYNIDWSNPWINIGIGTIWFYLHDYLTIRIAPYYIIYNPVGNTCEECDLNKDLIWALLLASKIVLLITITCI